MPVSELNYSTKICKNCGEEKHTTSFYFHKGSKDGLRGECKPCVIEKQTANRDLNKRKEYVKVHYQQNQERIKAKQRQYRAANLDKVREAGRKESKARRELDPVVAKERARSYAIKRKYGITLDQYNELLQKQNNACAVCERPVEEFKTSLAVDHDHKTGRIRGLLCTHCNYRMVAKHQDGSLLRKIADYIEQGTEWFVPPKPRRKKKKIAKNTIL